MEMKYLMLIVKNMKPKKKKKKTKYSRIYVV